MKKVKVKSAIAGRAGVTLYLENGDQMNLPANSWRTAEIMNKVSAPLARGEIVSIDIESYSAHKIVEEQSGGLIRFVKRKLRSILGSSANETAEEKVMAYVNGRELHGIENIERHIEAAVRSGNTENVRNFIARMSKVAEKRGHSVQDALEFMRHADLPIAQDGSIIAYKMLRKRYSDGKSFFVDCHTGRVAQRVGSKVQMADNMVDPDRRKECSNGLHIARRSYLRGFGGDAIVLVKIEPEDVIAVPEYDNSKMRVCAYHIIADVTDLAFSTLKSNKPMTEEPSLAKLLGEVLAGKHAPVSEFVTIRGQNGTDIEVTSANPESRSAQKDVKAKPVYALDDEQNNGPSYDIKELREKTEKERAKAKAESEKKPDPADPEPEKKAPEKRAKAKDESEKKATKEQPRKKVPKNMRDAIDFVRSGGSKREAEKRFKVCRKTLTRRMNEGY